MYTYVNPHSDIITQAQFAPVGGVPHVFVTLGNGPGALNQLRQWLAQSGLPLEEVSASSRLLVLRGGASQQQVLQAFANQGENLQPEIASKKFEPWKWRGITSIIGQSGQLVSGYMSNSYAQKHVTNVAELSKLRGDAFSIGGFAILNLIANIINIKFGAQEKVDPHHLAYLKQEFNDQFHTTHGTQVALPDAYAPSKVTKEAKGSFFARHSVSFGEIFLRTLGSFSLAFPVTNFKVAYRAFRAEGMSAGFKAAKNGNPATFIYGMAMLAGKVTSAFASEPDPYNPNPPSAWRTFREKVAFRLSSVIEGGGALYSTWDRYSKQKIHVGEKIIPDYPGAVGNAVFVGGYGIRYFAPYGSREVDMTALFSHIAEGINQLPAKERPHAVADATQWLAEHFSGKEAEKFRLPKLYEALSARVQMPAISSVPPKGHALTAPATTLSHVATHAALDSVRTPELVL